MATASRRASSQAFSNLQFRARANALLTSTALIPVATALALIPTEAFAQDATWDGETSIDWAEATNWDTNAVPGAGSTVTISNGALPDQPTISFGDSFTVTQTNVSAGMLTISGSLTSPITLSGTGLVTINAGGDVTGLIIVGEGAALQLNGSLGAGAPITLNGSGVANGGALRNLSGDNSVEGTITLGSGATVSTDAGVLRINNAVDNGGNLLTSNNASGSFTGISGVISGAGGFTKTGAGQTELTGINTFTGQVTLTDGTLALNGGAALADSVDVTVNGGTFTTFNDETIGSLSGTGGVVSAIGSTLTVGANNTSTTYAGSIIDNGVDVTSLAKTGTGTLMLTGANTYNGLTTVSAGTLRAASATALGSAVNSTTVENGAAVEIEGDFTIDEAFSIAGNGVADGGAIRIVSGSPTLTGAITLTADARINSDTTGAPIISSGITGSDRNLTLGGSGNLTVNGVIGLGTGGLTKDGAGTVTLSGFNNYTGLTRIRVGTLAITNELALGDSSSGTTVDDGGTLTLAGSSGDIRLSEALTLNGAGAVGTGALRSAGSTNFINNFVTLASDSRIEVADGTLLFSAGIMGSGHTLTFGGAGNASVLADVALGTGGVIKEGAGSVSLQRNNTYTGDTQVRGGVLEISSGGQGLSDTGRLTIETGAFARLIGAVPETFGSLSGGGNLELVGANQVGSGIVFGDAANTTFSGVISDDSGTARIDKRGTGTLTLTGANTYAGTTRILDGTIQLGDGGTTGSLGGGEIENFGALIFNRSNDATLTNLISGTGTLSKLGTGTLTLSGANTFMGLTTVSAGTLAISNGMALGTSDIATIVESGATLALDGNITLAEAITLSGTGAGGTGALRSISGSNSLSGAVTLESDARIEAGTGSLSINSLVSGTDRTVTFGGSGTIVIQSGALALGSGSVIMEGTGILALAGANTYTGDTIIRFGSLQFAGGSALSDSGRLTLEAGTNAAALFGPETIGSLSGSGILFLQSDGSVIVGDATSTTFSGNILQAGGTGTITKRGNGTLTLSGSSTYTGGTFVEAGTLTVTGSLASGVTVNGGTLAGNGMINGLSVINSGGTLAAGLSPGTLTFADLMLETGSITNFELGEAGVAGGANNDLIRVTGNLTLNGGTINVTRGTGFGVGAYTLFEFGTLSGALGNLTLTPLDGPFIGTLAVDGNSILLNAAPAEDLIFWNGSTTSPTGAVVGGSGTWNFTNNNFTGESGDFSGPWAGNGFQAVFGGAAGTVMIEAGVTVAPSGLAFLTDGYVITGGDAASRLRLDGPTGIDTGADIGATIAAVISGAGSLTKTGTGTLTLTGDNNYDGTTTVLGGTLQIGIGGTSGSLGAGNVLNNAALVFNRSDDVTVGNIISGTGNLTHSGTGTLTLNGANTYTGIDRVDGGGTLLVGNIGALGSQFEVVNNSTLDLGGFTAEVFSGLLEGNSTLSNGTLTIMANSPLAIQLVGSTINANLAGVGGVTAASGNNLLTGTNTYTGGTFVEAGTLTLSGSLASGVTVNGGTFTTTGMIAGGLANNVGGIVNLQGVLDGDVFNTGTITLTGTTTGIDIFEQTATGVFDLAGFDTTVGAITGAGSIMLGDATLTTGTDGVSTAFSGVISGTGVLVKVGTGRLVLTGTNTYSGGTTITGGVLQLGDGGAGGSIIGPVLNNGALVINRSDAVTFANVVSGTGMFVQDGTGTTTLTGANTYSGGTLISRGRLIGDTMSLLGQIQNAAALEFAQGTAGIFAGQLFGAGLFDKTGAGLLEFNGNNNGFTGGTFVRAGELRVTGGLADSQVTVLSGAPLSGTGTLGGLTASSGGGIAPGGGGAGTLGVNGAVNFQVGSTVQLDIRAGGPSDMIVSNGAAAVGGIAAFTNLGGVYSFNSEVLLLQADGGSTGTFDSATGFAGFGILYRPELVYTGTRVLLRFAPNLLTTIVGNSALTANQRSVVNAIDGAITAGYDPQPLFAIFNLPIAEQASAFDQISGEVYATATGVGFEQERLLREAVLGRVNAVAMAARETPEAGKGAGAWAQLLGGWGHGDGDGNASRFEADRMGFATGIDFGNANENGSWRAGLFGMQIQSDVTIDRLGSRAEVEQTGGGVYASASSGGFTAAIGGYLTEVDFRAFRNINLPGFAEDNVGTTEGTARQAFAELSYTFAAGQSMVRPFVGGAIGSFKLDGLTETGGSAALDVAAQSYSTGSVTAGVDGVVPVGKRLTLGGTLAGRAQLGDRAPQAQLALAAAPNQVFGVSGVQLDEVALAARLDATLAFEKNLTFSVGYTGLIGSTISDHGARATLQVQF